MADVTPERIAEILARTCLYCRLNRDDSCTACRAILDPLDALTEARGQVARVEALAEALLAFDCLDDEVPRGIDVPDDYESGIHDAARQLRDALAGLGELGGAG